MKKNVLLLETIAEEAFQLLRQEANVFPVYEEKSQEEILRSHKIDALITRGKGMVNMALLDKTPHLKVVGRCGVGLDNVDVKEASKRNIKVINAPGSNSGTIAEHTLSLMLLLVRNMYTSISKVKEGDWNWRNQYGGDELFGKTLGILGMGNIGSRVALMGEAFGMNIIFWDKFLEVSKYQSLPFEQVLREADIISLHVPLLEDTVHLIGKKELALMNPHTFLINTARGGLIDQKALLEALDEDKIAGFAADVLSEEPPALNDPILNHQKTLITAHVGSLTATTYKNMCLSTVKNVLAVLYNQVPEPQSIFNKKELNEVN